MITNYIDNWYQPKKHKQINAYNYLWRCATWKDNGIYFLEAIILKKKRGKTKKNNKTKQTKIKKEKTIITWLKKFVASLITSLNLSPSSHPNFVTRQRSWIRDPNKRLQVRSFGCQLVYKIVSFKQRAIRSSLEIIKRCGWKKQFMKTVTVNVSWKSSTLTNIKGETQKLPKFLLLPHLLLFLVILTFNEVLDQ